MTTHTVWATIEQARGRDSNKE